MKIHFATPLGVKYEDVVGALFAVYYDKMLLEDLKHKIVSNKLYYDVLGDMIPALDEILASFGRVDTIRLNSIELANGLVVLEIYNGKR
jgi:hypothetical protein